MTRLVVALIVLAACTPAATTQRASPTPVPTPGSASPLSAATTTITPATTPTATPVALPDTAQVAAAGSGVVWALVGGSRLFVSKDRGASWDERTAPPQLLNGNISFVDDTNGWALRAGSPATGCMAEGFQVSRTSDGARTWQTVFQAPFQDPVVSAGCKTNIAFSDGLHGYVSASTRDGGSWILRTGDGGASWAASPVLTGPLPTDPERSPSYVNRPGPVADFTAALFVATTTQLGPQVPQAIFRSTDRGATWTFAGTPPTTTIGITFLTPTHWIAWLLPQPSAETTDGGATWHQMSNDYSQAAPVAPQVVFGDANTGYATVRGSLKRTTDGGAHWTGIRTPGT